MAKSFVIAWADYPNTVYLGGKCVDMVANLVIAEQDERAELQWMVDKGEINQRSAAGGLVSLYFRDFEDDPSRNVHMMRWDNGLDMSLETTDIAEAKNAVEVMLQVEGLKYVRL